MHPSGREEFAPALRTRVLPLKESPLVVCDIFDPELNLLDEVAVFVALDVRVAGTTRTGDPRTSEGYVGTHSEPPLTMSGLAVQERSQR